MIYFMPCNSTIVTTLQQADGFEKWLRVVPKDVAVSVETFRRYLVNNTNIQM